LPYRRKRWNREASDDLTVFKPRRGKKARLRVDGEKKVVVPPETPIVTFVASDKSEVKPGAQIIIFGAVKKDDGTLEANRVNVGRDGIAPPM